MPLPRFTPVSVRGSLWGLICSYWFVPLSAAILIFGLGRTRPAVAMWIVVILAILALVGTVLVGGAEISATEDEIVVRRRFRREWRIPAHELRSIEEHIPLRPRMRSLAGWVFRGQGDNRTTIEIALFAPNARRELRRAFADILVSPDLGRPSGIR